MSTKLKSIVQTLLLMEADEDDDLLILLSLLLHKRSKESSSEESTNGNEIKVFCPKCNTEVSHTAEGIQQDQTKILIAKVYRYFEQEYEELKTIYGDMDLTPLSKVCQRTALATGVSEAMLMQILKEEERRNEERQREEERTREPPQKERAARKRRRQTTHSSSEEDSSDNNVEDIEQPSPSEETLVVKMEPPEYDIEEPEIEVKVEPSDDDTNNEHTDPIALEMKTETQDDEDDITDATPAPETSADTKRKAKKTPRLCDETSLHLLSMSCLRCTSVREANEQYYDVDEMGPEIISIIERYLGHKVAENGIICSQCFEIILKEISSDSGKAHGNRKLRQNSNVCVMCRRSLFTRRTHSVTEGPVKQYIAETIAPREIPEGGLLCFSCWIHIRRTLQQQGIIAAPVVERNTNTCVWCRRCFAQTRRHSLPEGPERTYIIKTIYPREIPPGGLVCYACWVAARRHVQQAARNEDEQPTPGPTIQHQNTLCATSSA